MKTTVRRGYLGSERVIIDSHGRVFSPSAGDWTTDGGVVIAVPGTYERWCDVPAAWLGGSIPYWR